MRVRWMLGGLAVLVAATGGCGGGAETPAPVPNGPGSGVAAVPAAEQPGKRPSPSTPAKPSNSDGPVAREAEKPGKPAADTAEADQQPSKKPAAAQESDAAEPADARPSKRDVLTPARREKLAASAARSAIKLYGIPETKISVGEAGRSVGLIVPAEHACSLPPDAAKDITKTIRTGAPWVRRIAVDTGAAGQSLTAYRAASCGSSGPPAVGGGEELYAQTAEGYRETKIITVTGKRWTVAWANYGGFFSIQVQNPEGEPTGDFFYATEPGSGKKTFTSGPGKFKLVVAGPTWDIKVYDGA